jgi:hypothetical protein
MPSEICRMVVLTGRQAKEPGVCRGSKTRSMIHVHEWIELAAQGVEALAVAIMVCFILVGTLGWLLHSVKKDRRGLREIPCRVGESVAGRP